VSEAIPDGCAGQLGTWVPQIDVLGAKVAVGGRGPEVTARVAAGEDARVKVCVRAAYALSALERCRSVAVPGLRSLNVAVRPPVGTTGRVEVAVQFAAEANRTRRTLVVRRAILTR
jgi:hypothetical protein